MSGVGAAWEDGDESDGEGKDGEKEEKEEKEEPVQSREGKWESGMGRCPVTGRRVLSGTEGLRRVLI